MEWALLIAQLILKYGPAAAEQIVAMVKKIKGPDDITDADWATLKSVVATPYDDYITVRKPTS